MAASPRWMILGGLLGVAMSSTRRSTTLGEGFASKKRNSSGRFRSFDEPGLAPEGSFKAAEARYTAADQVDRVALARWLEKARTIQWDYQNLRKTRGVLARLPPG